MADPREAIADQRRLPAAAARHEAIQREVAENHERALDGAVRQRDEHLARHEAERQRRGERNQPQRIVQQVQRRECRADNVQQSTSRIAGDRV